MGLQQEVRGAELLWPCSEFVIQEDIKIIAVLKETLKTVLK